MGYYDRKWRDAPGYCVHCDNLRPLNKAAVCEECWNGSPAGECQEWEEDEYHSQWYYRRFPDRARTNPPQASHPAKAALPPHGGGARKLG